MTSIDIIAKLKSIARYDTEIKDCGCDGPRVEAIQYELGDWVKWDDLNAIISMLEKTQEENTELTENPDLPQLPHNRVITALLARGETLEDAQEILRWLRQQVAEGEDPAEVLYEESLEPDYFMDII